MEKHIPWTICVTYASFFFLTKSYSHKVDSSIYRQSCWIFSKDSIFSVLRRIICHIFLLFWFKSFWDYGTARCHINLLYRQRWSQFYRGKKVIEVWNNMRVNKKEDFIYQYCVYYPLKLTRCSLDHSQVMLDDMDHHVKFSSCWLSFSSKKGK